MSTAAENLKSIKTWDHWIAGKAEPRDSVQYLDDLDQRAWEEDQLSQAAYEEGQER